MNLNILFSNRLTIKLDKESTKTLEYIEIKIEIQQEYDVLLENSIKLKSIPKHHHLHLLKLKERVIEIEPGLTASFFSQKNKMSQTKSVAG